MEMNENNESNFTFDNCDSLVDVKPVLQDFKVEFEYDSRFGNPNDESNHQMFHLQPDVNSIKEEIREEIPMNEMDTNWHDELEESPIEFPSATPFNDPLSLEGFTASESKWKACQDFPKVERVSDITKFKCDRQHCQKIFSEETAFINHMSTHRDLTKWKCPHCPEQFPFETLLMEHEKSHPEITIYLCGDKKCRKHFNSKEKLTEHFITHQQQNSTDQNTVQYTCRICQFKFRSITMLGKHLETHTEGNPFKCEHCGKTFVRISELNKHFQNSSVGEGKHFECPKCDQTFPWKCALNYHLKNYVHKKIFECEHCPKSFYLKIELDGHLKYHKKAKFRCDQCDRSFVRKDSLVNHKTIHTGEKQFKCDQCEKCYVTKNGLTMHQRFHKKT